MEGWAAAPRKHGMNPPPPKLGGDDYPVEEVEYSTLYRQFLPRTLRWLRLYGVAERHRQDVAQEAWIRVYRNLDSFDSERPFEPWLMTLTFRAACDHLKRADVRRERLSEAGEVEPQATQRQEDRMIDAARTLESLLPKLTPEHREVFIMADVEEMDPSEIAAALGLPINTVHSRLSRARDGFQRELERFRATEERRVGAGCILPAFLFDWRALLGAGREIPPVSVGTELRIWDGIQRGLDALEGNPGPGGNVSPPAAPRSITPFAGSPSPLSLLPALARLPWPLPLKVAATALGGGLAGAGLVWWLLAPAPPSPVIAQAETRPLTPSGSAAPSIAASPPPVAPPAPADAGAAPAYDPREELSTLEAAWTLYFQGKCGAARAKLGKRTGRVHAKDYADLRKKIEACLTGDGGIP